MSHRKQKSKAGRQKSGTMKDRNAITPISENELCNLSEEDKTMKARFGFINIYDLILTLMKSKQKQVNYFVNCQI